MSIRHKKPVSFQILIAKCLNPHFVDGHYYVSFFIFVTLDTRDAIALVMSQMTSDVPNSMTDRTADAPY